MALPPISVLDLAPVGQGSTAAASLATSTKLAQLAERRGFHRLWVAEHHNMPGIASSSPAVLIAHLAASTSAWVAHPAPTSGPPGRCAAISPAATTASRRT